jgi:hypothetical protein
MKTLSKRKKLRHVYKQHSNVALDHDLVGDGGLKWGVDRCTTSSGKLDVILWQVLSDQRREWTAWMTWSKRAPVVMEHLTSLALQINRDLLLSVAISSDAWHHANAPLSREMMVGRLGCMNKMNIGGVACLNSEW